MIGVSHPLPHRHTVGGELDRLLGELAVHGIEDLDKQVAKMKLEAMGVKIDRLTPEQEAYLAGWQEGT